MTGFVKGKSVHFDDRYLHVELEDGRVISTPMSWYPDLQSATMRELSNYSLICQATGIEWPDIDYHLSIESMLAFDTIRQVA
jgi:hypothetical protein